MLGFGFQDTRGFHRLEVRGVHGFNFDDMFRFRCFNKPHPYPVYTARQELIICINKMELFAVFVPGLDVDTDIREVF